MLNLTKETVAGHFPFRAQPKNKSCESSVVLGSFEFKTSRKCRVLIELEKQRQIRNKRRWQRWAGLSCHHCNQQPIEGGGRRSAAPSGDKTRPVLLLVAPEGNRQVPNIRALSQMDE